MENISLFEKKTMTVIDHLSQLGVSTISHLIILVDIIPKVQPMIPETRIKIFSYKSVAESTYVVTFVPFAYSTV